MNGTRNRESLVLLGRSPLFAILVSLMMLFSGKASADSYHWVDAQGGVHITDDLSKVPEQYRPKETAPHDTAQEASQGIIGYWVKEDYGSAIDSYTNGMRIDVDGRGYLYYSEGSMFELNWDASDNAYALNVKYREPGTPDRTLKERKGKMIYDRSRDILRDEKGQAIFHRMRPDLSAIADRSVGDAGIVGYWTTGFYDHNPSDCYFNADGTGRIYGWGGTGYPITWKSPSQGRIEFSLALTSTDEAKLRAQVAHFIGKKLIGEYDEYLDRFMIYDGGRWNTHVRVKGIKSPVLHDSKEQPRQSITLEETRRLAERGDSYSLFLLGRFYMYNYGLKQDRNISEYWFRLSAEQGLINAQYVFGLMYLKNMNDKTKSPEGKRWIKKAAESGFQDALFLLDRMDHDKL